MSALNAALSGEPFYLSPQSPEYRPGTSSPTRLTRLRTVSPSPGPRRSNSPVTQCTIGTQTTYETPLESYPCRVVPVSPSYFIWFNTAARLPNNQIPMYIFCNQSNTWQLAHTFNSPTSPFWFSVLSLLTSQFLILTPLGPSSTVLTFDPINCFSLIIWKFIIQLTLYDAYSDVISI